MWWWCVKRVSNINTENKLLLEFILCLLFGQSLCIPVFLLRMYSKNCLSRSLSKFFVLKKKEWITYVTMWFSIRIDNKMYSISHNSSHLAFFGVFLGRETKLQLPLKLFYSIWSFYFVYSDFNLNWPLKANYFQRPV